MAQQTILMTDTDILKKLSEVLDLLFKKRKPGANFQDGYCFNIAQFKRSGCVGKISISAISECLLNHRFNEAIKLLWILCQDRYFFDIVLYKGILVALDNLMSTVETDTIKTVTRDIRKLHSVNKLELQLEYLIHVLKKDMNAEEDSFYLEGKNARKWSIKIIPYIEQLYTAYCALISYIIWANVSRNEQSSQAITDKEFAYTIIHSFKQLIYKPGIWDIFVLKLIEMLEYYKQYDELEDILLKYVEVNPEHLNAYVYLCVHLHKHNAEPEKFIKFAKILAKLCPSDERILLLVQKWNELGKNLKKCLKILFAFLDYPINGCRILGWHLLSAHLQTAISSKKSSVIELINSSWEKRKSSWTYMHFKLSNISTEPLELIQWKVKVLAAVQFDHEYVENVKEKFPVFKEHLLWNRDSLPTTEGFRSLYKLNDNIGCS